MSTSTFNNPGSQQKYQGGDNQKQQQARENDERKHSLQSGSNAGRNNNSPRKGDKGERHQDSKKASR